MHIPISTHASLLCEDWILTICWHLINTQIQWSMRFEGEEVKVVALGTAWVAAITSLNFLRIYTDGGLQVRHINFMKSIWWYDWGLTKSLLLFIILNTNIIDLFQYYTIYQVMLVVLKSSCNSCSHITFPLSFSS